MQNWGQRIDELCERQVAFALYHLPLSETLSFCMAADGAVSDTGTGFLMADFDGTTCLIPSELTIPPHIEEIRRFPLLAPAKISQPATKRADYANLFRRAKEELSSGTLRKIVLARTADVMTPCPVSPWSAFCAAVSEFSAQFTVLVHTPQYGTWLSSTPELLLRGRDEVWETMALAGTRPCSNLPWDDKNVREQAIVADYVRSTLNRTATNVEAKGVCNLNSGDIEHLCTVFSFRMAAKKLGELLAELPPTPAVSGYPVATARHYLREHPDIDRKLYAGYMGEWSPGSAQLFVSLRCMQIFIDRCRLYAGGGIMPDSDEASEWLETEAKGEAMRRVIAVCCQATERKERQEKLEMGFTRH